MRERSQLPGSAWSATRRPASLVLLTATAAFCVLLLLAPRGPVSLAEAVRGPVATVLVIFLPVPLVAGLALVPPRWWGLGAALLLTVSLQIFDGAFNPLLLAAPVGGWLVGLVLRDRWRMISELRRTNALLRRESELLAEESVRLERARIARELHDIVAHGISVIVVQAHAGERLAPIYAGAPAEALGHIVEAVGQARAELDRLSILLRNEPDRVSPRRFGEGLESLISGARASGLQVSLSIDGNLDDLPASTSEAAFRVVQEALTNALKHASGAGVEISIQREPERLRLTVSNGPTGGQASGLQASGGNRGVHGMRARAAATGGTLTAGPAPEAAWQVTAAFPLTPA